MNWDIVEGNWKQFSGMMRVRWGQFNGDGLGVIAGQRVELAGRIQKGYGITKDEADQQMKRFARDNKDYRRKRSR